MTVTVRLALHLPLHKIRQSQYTINLTVCNLTFVQQRCIVPLEMTRGWIGNVCSQTKQKLIFGLFSAFFFKPNVSPEPTQIPTANMDVTLLGLSPEERKPDNQADRGEDAEEETSVMRKMLAEDQNH